MNVIAWDYAYCLYPRATLEERRSLVCRADGPNQVTAEAKYRARGWEIVHSLPPCAPYDRAFPSGLRFMGDPNMWRLKLDTAQILPPFPPSQHGSRLSTDPVAATSWKLDQIGPGGDVPHVSYVTLKSNFLRNQYVCADAYGILMALASVQGEDNDE